MTTEDDFQRALDADPDDHQTRLIFADWLDDREDQRAAGYRALGRLQRSPTRTVMSHSRDIWWLYGRSDNRTQAPSSCLLPWLWFKGLPDTTRSYPYHVDKEDRWWEHFDVRREADDAAAMAFLKLSPEQRSQLLEGKIT